VRQSTLSESGRQTVGSQVGLELRLKLKLRLGLGLGLRLRFGYGWGVRAPLVKPASVSPAVMHSSDMIYFCVRRCTLSGSGRSSVFVRVRVRVGGRVQDRVRAPFVKPASVSPAVNSPRYAAADRDTTGLRLILLHTYSSTYANIND